ncbi:MAG: permease prefix domain 1-containing protein [Treponema sp.]|jgi:MFS family permease|nr:permease prefix domain 1-containing protein [Treponema sp.]
MKAKSFVDSLFEGYEETSALADFKEELLGNLNAKIESFVKKGMDEESAFNKASAELGDISALANELSRKKRAEVFEEAYMDIRKYMPAKRVAAYVVFGVLAMFGIAAALITFFSTRLINDNFGFSGFFAGMMPFLIVAAAGFTFLGVTQETASMYPVSKKRGVWYAAAAALITFGSFTILIVFTGILIAGDLFTNGFNFAALIPVIFLMFIFIVPGAGMLVFLVLTEKDRLKPWAKSFRSKTAKDEMAFLAIWNDPVIAGRFGIFSGAIWIFAIGFFILLGFLIGFKYSWLVFIFATAFQLLILGSMFKR